MKKLKVLLVLLLVAFAGVTFAACGHKHEYSAEWSYDSTQHWHECDCGEKADLAYHTFDASGKCPTCENEGYFVSSKADLVAFRNAVNEGNTFAQKEITLIEDIDLAGENWAPIGTAENPFMGTFNGGNFTIANLTIENETATAENMSGLFGCVKNATIKNFKLTGVDIDTACQITGAVVARVIAQEGNALVEGITTAGTLVGQRVSGVVFEAIGWETTDKVEIKNCTNNITITGADQRATGIVGTVKTYGILNVEDCTNKADITLISSTSEAHAAGIAGYVMRNNDVSSTAYPQMVTIDNCVNEGDIYAETPALKQNNVGGILTSAHEGLVYVVSNCTNKGDLVGKITCTDSTNSGLHSKIGGIVGSLSNASSLTVSDCTNLGDISSTCNIPSKKAAAGGIVGYVTKNREVVIEDCQVGNATTNVTLQSNTDSTDYFCAVVESGATVTKTDCVYYVDGTLNQAE
ncbi:MAG: hypothetical protein E7378_03100 [Clostridiales bacterium]|nr:hypothetical protein [Clostridiales bacterium]